MIKDSYCLSCRTLIKPGIFIYLLTLSKKLREKHPIHDQLLSLPNDDLYKLCETDALNITIKKKDRKMSTISTISNGAFMPSNKTALKRTFSRDLETTVGEK